MLELPPTIDVHQPNGDVAREQPMWTYWNLQEGEISVDPKLFSLEDGSMPPVVHLDTDAPLYTDDGKLVTDEPWGIYYKQDRHGIQGGASPLTVGPEAPIDPYPNTTDVDEDFPDMWCAALSHAMSRFEGKRPLYKQARSGGMGAFTVDNFPVFDYVRPNVYGIFDSNHGYKMLGVGREVAKAIAGDGSRLLHPSAWSASRPAICTRSRVRPTPGPDAAGPRSRRATPRPGRAVSQPRGALGVEALRPLQPDHGHQPAVVGEHRGGDRVQPGLALAGRLGDPRGAYLGHGALDLRERRQRARRVPLQRFGERREHTRGVSEHELADGGCVGDRRAPDLGPARDAVRAGSKSTVTPSPCAGSESVAVSPVSRTSCSSSGRARSRRSRRASAALPRWTSRSPSCQRRAPGSRSTRPAPAASRARARPCSR